MNSETTEKRKTGKHEAVILPLSLYGLRFTVLS